MQDWQHPCCGPPRKTGDLMTVSLRFAGKVENSGEESGIESGRQGDMVIVGPARDARCPQPGRIVQIGSLAFGVETKLTGSRLRCTGKLWEERHVQGQPPIGVTTGPMTSVRWRPAILDRRGDNTDVVVGYQDGHLFHNTEKLPDAKRAQSPWVFVFTLEVDTEESGSPRPLSPPRF